MKKKKSKNEFVKNPCEDEPSQQENNEEQREPKQEHLCESGSILTCHDTSLD